MATKARLITGLPTVWFSHIREALNKFSLSALLVKSG